MKTKTMTFTNVLLVGAVICFALVRPAVAQQTSPSPQRERPRRFSSWRDFSPESGAFSIRFPYEPRYEQQPRESGVTLHKLTANGRNATLGMVFYSISPSQAQELQARYRAHDSVSTERQLGRRLLNQRTLTVGGYPALELSVEVPNYGYTRTLSVATDTHFYILTAGTPRRERLQSAEVEYFFNSLQFAGR